MLMRRPPSVHADLSDPKCRVTPKLSTNEWNLSVRCQHWVPCWTELAHRSYVSGWPWWLHQSSNVFDISGWNRTCWNHISRIKVRATLRRMAYVTISYFLVEGFLRDIFFFYYSLNLNAHNTVVSNIDLIRIDHYNAKTIHNWP